MVNTESNIVEWTEELKTADAEFLKQLQAFTPDQINQESLGGGWTAGQVAEHIHKSDKGMIYMLSGSSRKADRNPEQGVDMIKKTFLDFDTKLQSPDFIIPEKKVYQKKELIARFEKDRATIHSLLESLDLTELCTAMPFPGFGEISRIELLVFIVCHTKRHVRQLDKLKA